MKNINFISVFSLFLTTCLTAQVPGESIFRNIEIHIDSLVFNNNRNTVNFNNEKNLYFTYDDENEVAEVVLFPQKNSSFQNLILLPSGDFEQVDSLMLYDETWRCKIRFRNLTRTQFLKLQFRYKQNGIDNLEIVRLLPCTHTYVDLKPSNDELYIGEEKVFDLITNNAENIRFSGEWTEGLGIDYRIEKLNEQLRLHVVPNKLGIQKLMVTLQAEKPVVDQAENRVITQIKPLEFTFHVKTSRLRFLNIDKREITLDENSRKQGVEIQLDYDRSLEINRTYRIENQENPGGILIAEIFTRSFLSNNRILCYLKTYNYHRNSDGYLYIKDGDEAKFISNFSITPATSVTRLSVMREGSDWSNDLSVYPGETIGVKIEGLALYKARFHFEELTDITSDTLIQNENEVILKLQVPINIGKKRVNLYNYNVSTGHALSVREYEIPRPFDYIYMNYGDINRVLAGVHGPVLFEKAIRDIVLTFNNDKIDSDHRLFGKQYLTFDVRITGPNNELIDMRTISNVVICPSDQSPRYNYYDKRNCTPNEISLNKYLRRSTNDLDDWSRIYLSVKTNPEKYGGESQQKDLEIILKKKHKFDIDVSFPAGLVTVSRDDENPDQTTFSNLYGISMAMVAQFAFYHPEKIAKLRPYRIGAGFLALDAFNFQSERQDLALVALASLYPTTRDKKLAFPLYIGAGYQFKAEKWMMLIGPGISVKL
ncbi:MAG: hypothetical protein JW830_11280 [Bacteroidales bacterium]|nr:hypothetical protein [Bacteroidales bacterium]